MNKSITITTSLQLFIMCIVLLLRTHCAFGMSIADAKAQPNGQLIILTEKIVTFSAPNFFYIQEDGRYSGIRVNVLNHGMTGGMRVDVAGTMRTITDNERYVTADSVTLKGSGNVEPLFMKNKSSGGADWQYDPSTGKGQAGISGASGLNNIGLLVKVQGLVMSGAPGDAGAIFVDDGSGAHLQVVLSPSVTSPGCGARVAVTGVVSCDKRSYNFRCRVLLARDIQVLEPGPSWKYTGEMAYVPYGEFQMGNTGSEPYIGHDESQHWVYLSDYHIGKYEVTRGEYRQFLEAGGYSNPSYWSSSHRIKSRFFLRQA